MAGQGPRGQSVNLFAENILSNFVVSITFPKLLAAFTPQGAVGWYAAWK
jgi:hypothetical protein